MSDDEIRCKEVIAHLANNSWEDLQIVSAEIRAPVISRLRKVLDGSDPDLSWHTGLYFSREARVVLLRLGDPKTMNEAVADYQNEALQLGNVSMTLSIWVKSAQPLLIPLVAGDLSLEDGDQLADEGVDDLSRPRGPLSAGAALRAVAILESSEVFSTK